MRIIKALILSIFNLPFLIWHHSNKAAKTVDTVSENLSNVSNKIIDDILDNKN